MKFADTLETTVFESPLGPMTLAASEQGLAGAWFEGDPHRPDTTVWPAAPVHPLLHQAVQQLQAYFERQATSFDLPLDLSSGTAFQQTVWRALLELPHGSSTSYGALSARIGKPQAMRAVGAAIGRNPLAIIVPCHRVLGADGSLTGYAGGLPRKIALLELEGAYFRP